MGVVLAKERSSPPRRAAVSVGRAPPRLGAPGPSPPAGERPYETEPILPHFGVYVRGFPLEGEGPLPDDVVRWMVEDLRRHRALVFKNAGRVSGERQVQISKQLGVIESTFYKHPRSPHPDIFRVSNDEAEGCTNVGRTGWHLDGTFQAMPFKYQTMYFPSVCEGGDTWFVPLKDFYEMQDDETRNRWDRLWMLTGSYAHPMVYKHPVRGDTTMLFHCGPPFCSGWALDDKDMSGQAGGQPRRKLLAPHVIQEELTELLDAAVDKIGIKMHWEEGDFAINDNLGNCHYAAPGTQNSKKRAGLRVLHRTTIAGETVPTKADGRQSFLPPAAMMTRRVHPWSST